jgi:hypothetical protein
LKILAISTAAVPEYIYMTISLTDAINGGWVQLGDANSCDASDGEYIRPVDLYGLINLACIMPGLLHDSSPETGPVTQI